jgi:type IV secretory pathway protease TraF
MVAQQPPQLDFGVLMMANSLSHNRLLLVTVGLIIAILAVLLIWLSPRPYLIWNASKSVPIGWYIVEHRQPKLHEIAVVKLEDWPELYASSRGYLPINVWLLKPVATLSPALVCRYGRYVFIDGKLVARARVFDHQYRILPHWNGCYSLKSDELFLIARPKDSFDSRYFGPVKMGQVAGMAHRIHLPFEWVPVQFGVGWIGIFGRAR